MSENKDPAIKLFGKTIPLPESQNPVEAADKFEPETQTRAELEEMDSCKEITEVETRDLSNKSSSLNDIKEDNHKTSSENKEKEDPKPEENQAERDTVCDDKVLKKPDKILPCPRCKSLETKFCYYNNYNVNQPRHFCKNCQRYWTAGGTMRNVPVGAGRRKNKLPSSQYHNILMSSNGIPNARIENPNSGSNQVPQKENGTVLNFCSEVPLCDSMATMLNLWEKKKNELPENVVQMELGGISGRPAGEWNVPLFGFNGSFNGCSGNGSLTLGKHSREGNSHVEEKQEKCLWIPKTLRIDDPNMASKSSIWDNLSIKPYQDKLVKNGGIFKPFQGKVHRADAVHVLQANPAAFSRFQTFQETT